jgi:hypothetical protein
MVAEAIFRMPEFFEVFAQINLDYFNPFLGMSRLLHGAADRNI